MPLPKYADIDKPAKDLLSEDFPLEPKLTFKTNKAPVGLKIDLVKNADIVNGTLKANFRHAATGINVEEKWTTANEVTTEVSAEDKLGAGTKVALKSLFSPKSGVRNLNGTVEYITNSVHGEATVEHSFEGKPASVGLSALFAHANFRFGASARGSGPHNIDNHSVGVQYLTSDMAITSTLTNGTRVDGSIYQEVRPELTAALKFSWDRNSADPAKLELGARYRLASDAFAKAKVDTDQRLTLSYTCPLQRGVNLTLGTQLTPQAGGFTGKLGFNLNVF